MQEITLRSLMTTNVMTACPSTPISDVVRTMKERLHSCIVITENDRPVGIITERDIVRVIADLIGNPNAFDQPAQKIMSEPVVTVDGNASLFEAVVIAKSKKIRHLPVDDAEGKLIGLVNQSDLVAAHFQIQEIINRMQDLSLEDELLRIGNHRAMEADLKHTHAASCRYQRPYSVALFDVDYFRNLNDHYGRAAGDRALQRVASYFKDSIRASDRMYRYGGEKILLILPETFWGGAQALAQRLIDGIVDCRIPHEQNAIKVLTLSAGVSSRDPWAINETWQDVLHRANEALYQAKSQGRNRVAAARTESFAAQDITPFQGVIPRQ
jgi:diguanylate cyclase (GGDEF)-like protein